MVRQALPVQREPQLDRPWPELQQAAVWPAPPWAVALPEQPLVQVSPEQPWVAASRLLPEPSSVQGPWPERSRWALLWRRAAMFAPWPVWPQPSGREPSSVSRSPKPLQVAPHRRRQREPAVV